VLMLALRSFGAVVYLRSSDGNNADSGATWALAKATLADTGGTGALTAAGAGGTVYVSDNHAETQATTMTLASPGTAASPVRIICVDDAAEPPTARAITATVSTTGPAALAITASLLCMALSSTVAAGPVPHTTLSSIRRRGGGDSTRANSRCYTRMPAALSRWAGILPPTICCWS